MPGLLNVLVAGGVPFTLNLEAAFSLANAISPSNATASIAFLTDGTVTEVGGAGFTLVTRGLPAGLEIFVTGTGDTPTGSAINTWLALSAQRTFTLQETTDGEAQKAFSGTYSVRTVGGHVPLGSASFSITAHVTI